MTTPAIPGAERTTVFIVDDHDVVRKGLRFYLSAHPDIAIVGEAGDTQTAIEAVTELVPDVVLMDLVLPLKPGGAAFGSGGGAGHAADPPEQPAHASRRVDELCAG